MLHQELFNMIFGPSKVGDRPENMVSHPGWLNLI